MIAPVNTPLSIDTPTDPPRVSDTAIELVAGLLQDVVEQDVERVTEVAGDSLPFERIINEL